jgi:CDGSH-type Zn-finger protein
MTVHANTFPPPLPRYGQHTVAFCVRRGSGDQTKFLQIYSVSVRSWKTAGFVVAPTVTGLRKRQQFFGSTQVDTMSETPQIAGRQPIPVKVEEGKSYWWCACGLSKTQPFCDGSHKATTFVPVEFKPTASAEVWFCACKRSSRKPMCDGSHQKL